VRKGGFRGMSISPSRGDDHLQTVSEDGLRGVVDFRSNIEI